MKAKIIRPIFDWKLTSKSGQILSLKNKIDRVAFHRDIHVENLIEFWFSLDAKSLSIKSIQKIRT